MTKTVPFFAVFLLGLAAAANEPAPDVRDRVPLGQFVIQAHRGGGAEMPENTLETFQYAWRLGVVPEADVRMSADGVVCAFHDPDFSRVVKDVPAELKQKGVSDLAWKELQSLDVGAFRGDQFAGQRIPKIEDVIQAMAGHPRRWLYLDVKKVSLKRLADWAGQYGVGRQLILTSTHHDHLRQWKRLVPDSQTLLWMRGTEAELAGRLKDLEKTDFEGVTSLQIHVFMPTADAEKPFRPSPDFLRAVGKTLRERGIAFQALVWGEHGPDVYSALLDLGVESFATDHPEMTLQAVKDYYAARNEAAAVPQAMFGRRLLSPMEVTGLVGDGSRLPQRKKAESR
ncbi:MAG: hypothetical protein JW809_04965 [Pirellulales bacterium]|nr:hypothetical protein [Pirellulales bacterium]